MDGHHIVVVGEGLTGSNLTPHLARMPQVSRVTIVDPDSYGAGNVSQNIDKLDYGKPKAAAQALKLRLINPRLLAHPFVARIEDIPLALLTCSVIVSCVDSRLARQWLNQIACWLGIVLVDMGVLGSQNLARVSVYKPSENTPCLECAWGSDEYAQVEQEYPCGAGDAPQRPTLAPSPLGALAAALAAFEVGKVLDGDLSSAALGREVVVDAVHHKMLVSTSRRNPVCRFDHQNWIIEPWDADPHTTTLGWVVDNLGPLRLEGHRFVTGSACPACGLTDYGLKLNRPKKKCAWCGRRMAPANFDARDCLDSSLSAEYRGLTLEQVGLRAGDVITCGERHLHISPEIV